MANSVTIKAGTWLISLYVLFGRCLVVGSITLMTFTDSIPTGMFQNRRVMSMNSQTANDRLKTHRNSLVIQVSASKFLRIVKRMLMKRAGQRYDKRRRSLELISALH